MIYSTKKKKKKINSLKCYFIYFNTLFYNTLYITYFIFLPVYLNIIIIIRKMLTDALRVMVNNSFKKSFYGKRKK